MSKESFESPHTLLEGRDDGKMRDEVLVGDVGLWDVVEAVRLLQQIQLRLQEVSVLLRHSAHCRR